MTSKGAEYRGSQTHTVTYRSCQRWDVQTPHVHTFRHGWMFADGNATTAGNQCRNPGGVRDRPWCMTSDPAVTWEYCNVPLCGCRATRSGIDYTGAISRTISGRVCQRWDVQQPHSHTYWTSSRSRSPGGGTARVTENYCRNPDPWDSNGPWCYTVDPVIRWEYCNVPFCECKYTRTGVEYSGRISQTRSGVVCQQWSSQHPHQHDYVKDSHFPDDIADDAVNYCRNPDPLQRTEGPWCFTKSPEISWDYCNIPLCEETDESTVDEVLIASHQPEDARRTRIPLYVTTETVYSDPRPTLTGVTSTTDVGWSSTSVFATLIGGTGMALLLLVSLLILVLITRKPRSLPKRKTDPTMLLNEFRNSGDGADNTINVPKSSSADDTTRRLLDVDHRGASGTAFDDVTANSNGIQFYLKAISSSTSPLYSLSARSRGVACTSGSGSSCHQCEPFGVLAGLHGSDSDAHPARSSISNSSGVTRVARVRDENWCQLEMTSLSLPTCSCGRMSIDRRHMYDDRSSRRTNYAADAFRSKLSDLSSLTVSGLPARRCATGSQLHEVAGSRATWHEVVRVDAVSQTTCCEHVQSFDYR